MTCERKIYAGDVKNGRRTWHRHLFDNAIFVTVYFLIYSISGCCVANENQTLHLLYLCYSSVCKQCLTVIFKASLTFSVISLWWLRRLVVVLIYVSDWYAIWFFGVYNAPYKLFGSDHGRVKSFCRFCIPTGMIWYVSNFRAILIMPPKRCLNSPVRSFIYFQPIYPRRINVTGLINSCWYSLELSYGNYSSVG